MKGKKLLSLLLAAVILISSAASALAVDCTGYADWFAPYYKEMKELSLIPSSFNGYDLQKNITRGEMCALAVHAFKKATGNAIDPERTDYFSDTTEPTILEAYELGIVNGYPDGTFRPKQLLTRQEFFQILVNFCTAAAFKPSAGGSEISAFKDSASVSDWAKSAANICIKYGYVNGSGKNLLPTSSTTRQEAMTMFLRCYKVLSEYYYELVLSAGVQVDESELNVTVSELSGTRYVIASSLNVRDGWTANSTKVGTLSYGATVTVTGKCSNGWVRIQYSGHTAYVKGDYLAKTLTQSKPVEQNPVEWTPVSGSGTASDVASLALSFVGYPYVYGAESPSSGFDCSGLMYYCYKQFGYSMNRVADDQMDQGISVSKSELQVGDLVFFGSGNYASHVGMYIGNGNFVHASTPSTGVRINALDETYYLNRYIGARRIIY